jgi:hypothetical protein
VRGLDGAGGSNDVDKDVVQDVGIQGTLVQAGQASENFAFPRAVHHAVAAVLFQAADPLGQVEPPIDQLQDGVVNAVDLVPDLADVGGHRTSRGLLAVYHGDCDLFLCGSFMNILVNTTKGRGECSPRP